MSPLCGKKGEAAKGVEGETKEGYIGRNKGTICGPICGPIWGTIWGQYGGQFGGRYGANMGRIEGDGKSKRGGRDPGGEEREKMGRADS